MGSVLFRIFKNIAFNIAPQVSKMATEVIFLIFRHCTIHSTPKTTSSTRPGLKMEISWDLYFLRLLFLNSTDLWQKCQKKISPKNFHIRQHYLAGKKNVSENSEVTPL